MAADHWMRFNVGDYLADTMHLSTVQHGVYVLLIMHCFKRGNLPAEIKDLARIVKLSGAQWRKHAAPVMALFRLEKDGWHHRRIDLERTRAHNARMGPNGAGVRARPEPEPQNQNQNTPRSPRSKRGANGGGVVSFRPAPAVRNAFVSAASDDMMEDRDGRGGVQAETGSPRSRALAGHEGHAGRETKAPPYATGRRYGT